MLSLFEWFFEGTSIVRRTRAAKRAAFTGKSAMSICKNQNPSLYNRYVRLNNMRKDLKEKIMRTYGPRARMNAMKKIR